MLRIGAFLVYVQVYYLQQTTATHARLRKDDHLRDESEVMKKAVCIQMRCLERVDRALAGKRKTKRLAMGVTIAAWALLVFNWLVGYL